ncbi:MAG: phosphoribosylanthranilate isomerase [Pseudomonadota bacterium]|nr:phosphoribosylanthranilate isomerase [Pseudomonadota bacterium]
MRTRVKICGLTNLEDALTAAEAGADLLGFIFADSPRRLEPLVAEKIIAALPPLVRTVGVFVDEKPETILEIAGRCRLDYLQLHGKETPADCLLLADWKIIKAFRVGVDEPLPELEHYKEQCEIFLYDTYVTGMAGGSGMTFDWQLLDRRQAGRYFILAGGLTPENVGRAIETVRPWAVDVSSGVELEPGRKDRAKIESFMNAVRRSDEQA